MAKPAASRRGRVAKKPARKLPRGARYAKSVRPPDGATLRYRMALRALVKRWWAKAGAQAIAKANEIAKPEVERTDDDEPSKRVRLTDYSGVADGIAPVVASVAKDIGRHSEGQFKRLGIKLGDSAPDVAKLVPSFRKENVDLVKTMLRSQQDKLEGLLSDGGGRRVESLTKDIEARLGVTTRHAELLARDQTLKLNAQITRGRMAAAGITSYVWTTAGDERVRSRHDDLDGETFDFDDPPVTNDDGDTNNPGEDYQCRCVAFPVLPEIDGDDDEAGADAPETEPQGNEPDAEPPPEEDTEPPIVARASELADALRSEHSDAREIVRSQVALALPTSTSKDIEYGRPLAGKIKTEPIPGANAFHDFQGQVVVTPETKRGAEVACRFLAQGRYDEAFRIGAPNPENMRRLEVLNNLRTVVHEEVHGFSRVGPRSYRGVGRILEEVGTELTARDIIAGLSTNIAENPAVRGALGFGSYAEYIDGVTALIQLRAGVSKEAAHALIRKAHATRICAPGKMLESAREHLHEFLAGLDQPQAVTDHLYEDLLKFSEQ